ncbi:rhomboid family intramembrane serine protease GlpG [Shewanella sp. NFH-SH190041]|uniref:rhomboid family intramembrane serine protease GlpG n=1 Tax=Shewanella sp. NFH-SH190041 TaxID=2950245 RepID=UPI0021C257A0|nr:rhomboid family intramembrane serine protease GlpG [Shewanella sp. NFH-SH190041]BDM62754.1 rhomboid family intramembrane serine protease GlpG [Shewanella sp. NFH-SH190041]
MIEFGILPNIRAAQALVDYLKGEGIPCKVQQAQQGVTLFVINPADLPRAQAEFDHFLRHPGDSKYLQASWDYGSTATQLDYGKPSAQLLRQFLAGAGPLTLLVFICCVVIYLFWNMGYANSLFATLGFFGVTPYATLHEFWRVFTPSLIHFSAMHIIFNLLWWWYLGGRIENRIGTGTLFILLLVGGTLPNILQFMMGGPNFGGLSGVVYALAGYTWVMGRQRPEAGIGLPPAYMGFMILWLILGFTDLFGLSMANGAHLGGLLVGLLQGFIDSRKRT